MFSSDITMIFERYINTKLLLQIQHLVDLSKSSFPIMTSSYENSFSSHHGI